ncbi:MAG: MFS transporter [Mangrovibacterium sp.]
MTIQSVARESKTPSGAWLTVALLFVVAALNYLDRTMITTMRESIVSSVPMTDAQFGLLTSVFLWVYGLLSPFAGFIADRFKKQNVIIGSLLVWSAVTWLTGHASTFEELLITRALMGISEAFYIPAALSLIVDYHKGTTQSLAIGIHLAGTTVGQSLGFLGGLIAEEFTWGYAFNCFGVIGILYAVSLVFMLKQPHAVHVGKDLNDREKVRFSEAIKVTFSKRAFIYLLLFWCLAGIVGWLIMGWLPTYYMDRFNLSQGIAGLYATAYLYPASILGLITGGFWADTWNKTNPYARILVPAIGLGVAAPCIFMASYVDMLIPVIVFFMLYAFTKMFVDSNLMPVLCMLIDVRYRATGYGILNMLATIAGGIGIFIAGMLRDSRIDLKIVYQCASLCIVLCVLLLLLIKMNKQKQASLTVNDDENEGKSGT